MAGVTRSVRGNPQRLMDAPEVMCRGGSPVLPACGPCRAPPGRQRGLVQVPQPGRRGFTHASRTFVCGEFFMMESKRCTACGQAFRPRPQIPQQCYCAAPACQRERRRSWQLAKRESDPDYHDNQVRAQRAWPLSRTRSSLYFLIQRSLFPTRSATGSSTI